MPAQAMVIVPYLQNHPAAAVRQLRDQAVGLDQRWRHAGKLVGQQPSVPGSRFAVARAYAPQPHMRISLEALPSAQQTGSLSSSQPEKSMETAGNIRMHAA